MGEVIGLSYVGADSRRHFIHGTLIVASKTTNTEATGRTTPVDAYVGKRIRLRRGELGMTQERLADALGLTFQQVQKYEKGANRVGASRLFDLARVLEVPIGYFFDELSPQASALGDFSHADIPTIPSSDPTLKRETLDLMRAYNNIRDPQIRRRIFDLARALADGLNPQRQDN
ncbi:MAG TPA: helix-turn-helix transcriptional regulator [Magnetospirillum sp.]|nr:helix-turn-helix transcriptional regulator [Magnetospirillum sp.]